MQIHVLKTDPIEAVENTYSLNGVVDLIGEEYLIFNCNRIPDIVDMC